MRKPDSALHSTTHLVHSTLLTSDIKGRVAEMRAGASCRETALKVMHAAKGSRVTCQRRAQRPKPADEVGQASSAKPGSGRSPHLWVQGLLHPPCMTEVMPRQDPPVPSKDVSISRATFRSSRGSTPLRCPRTGPTPR
jgi:hypothetical protein